VFNAILVVVSHVVDPVYRDDKFALSRLDYAMSMINRMSISHACAQRAYFFLQQLLSYMDKSLFVDRHTQNLTGPPHASRWSQQSQQPPSSTSATLPEQNDDFQPTPHADFFALLDVTQGLAENLGSHLESHEAMGSVMWSWMDDSITGPADTITIASNYGAQ
jgi:salicylate hydroxylase